MVENQKQYSRLENSGLLAEVRCTELVVYSVKMNSELAEASQTKAQELVENDLFNQARVRAEKWTDTARGRWGEWDRPFEVWFCLKCRRKFRSEDASKPANCGSCGANMTLINPFDIKLVSGANQHVLRVFAYDNAGNWGLALYIFTVESTSSSTTLGFVELIFAIGTVTTLRFIQRIKQKKCH